MPEFAYIARDLTGNRVEGTLAAGTEREVLASLSARDLFPLKVASAEKNTAATRSPKVRGTDHGDDLQPNVSPTAERRAAITNAGSDSPANTA